MPHYDYRCKDCGGAFEIFQKMTDEPLTVCPECSGEMKRLIGAGVPPIFKGSGFYQTDYKSTGNGKAAAEKSSTAPACASCPSNTAGSK